MATNFNIPIQNSLNTPLKTDFSTQNAVNSSSDNVWKADLQETTEFGGDTYIYSPHTCKEHCLGYIICWRPHSKALVSLLPRFYLGVKAPAACCHKAPAVPLTGVNCVDSGRNYTMTRGNFEKILSVAGQPEELEMQR